MRNPLKDSEPLSARYTSRKSFYKKAEIRREGNKIILRSYNTDVAYIKNGKVVVLGRWGNTTTRHIKEFLQQHGFKIGSGSKMLKDYGK